MSYYLSGTTAHTFNAHEVGERAAKNLGVDAYVIRNADGGAHWIAYLAKKPVQHGQKAFTINPGERVYTS